MIGEVYESVSDITERYNVVLFSSVLQYLEPAAKIVADVIKPKPDYVIIERKPVGLPIIFGYRQYMNRL